LELGDLDALFEPVGSGTPENSVGLRQRLQVLGYLYTPFGHPSIVEHTRRCWAYYKTVHNEPNDARAKALLVRELKGNLLTLAFPTSGQILAPSRLPRPYSDHQAEEFAAIRFPGGYTTTTHTVSKLNGGDHELNNHQKSNVPAKYQLEIGGKR